MLTKVGSEHNNMNYHNHQLHQQLSNKNKKENYLEKIQ